MIEKKFIDESLKRQMAKDYIRKEMAKAGIIDVNIQRTTLNTRIIIAAERPGIVIGRKGRGIVELTQTIESKLGIKNPQIELADIGNPDLEPSVVARWIARMLERGYKGKRAMQRALDKIKRSGAMGAEILIKGTVRKGLKARQERVFFGYMKKSGDSVKNIREAKTQAHLKQGVLGITVRIVPPNVVFPDKINIGDFIQRAKVADQPSKKVEEEPNGDSETEGNKKPGKN